MSVYVNVNRIVGGPAANVNRAACCHHPFYFPRLPMNALESQLDYPLGDALPDTGSVIQIAPGLLWLRMGLPFALNHINLWLLEDEIETETGRVRGWTVIDCGISSDATREAW